MTRWLLRMLLVGTLALFGVGLWAEAAGADNCSSPGDCEQTGGYNGIIAVVGGAAAVAAAAAAAIANTPEGEETDLAIVQVSTDTIDVEIGGIPGQLTLTGWNVDEDGLKQVAMSLAITAAEPGLTVSPAEGTGTLAASITVDEASLAEGTELIELTASGSWEGKTATEKVTVNIAGDLELKLTDETPPVDPGGPIGSGGATGGASDA